MRISKWFVAGAVAVSMNAAAKDKDFKEKHPRRAEVNERIRNQDKRIDKAEASGRLTNAQAQKMEGQLSGIKAQERAGVKTNGGYLTKPEQKQLNQELNGVNREIKGDEFKDQHPRRAEVNSRVRSEDARIEQGEKSGTLTQQQAQTLDGEVAGVKAQEHAEVKANGGYLTKPEQQQLNQELNQDSQQIYQEKHAGN